MGVVTQVEAHKDLILNHNQSEVFDPYIIKPDESLQLLTELSLLRKGALA
ncbi:MAG: hypothetical protein ACJA0N_002542 [Pseudohongiellaceae bacterium]|jgi:hypothetical protein